MESSPTYKKATAALDEAARARLRGPFIIDTTPGHEDVDDGLVKLVDEFYNGDGEEVVAKEAVAPQPAEWKDTLRAALAGATADAAAAWIRAESERAVRDAGPSAVGGERIRKRVVERLRARGFDAGLCRSSWERSSSVPAGSHEYVDVILAMGSSSTTHRYVVEVNFAAEFEIARPSAEYRELLPSLPPVLVARPEAFKEVAAAMCAAAAESIRGAGMHVPPWRRARYVQAKWNGHYKESGRHSHADGEAGRREHYACRPPAWLAVRRPEALRDGDWVQQGDDYGEGRIAEHETINVQRIVTVLLDASCIR